MKILSFVIQYFHILFFCVHSYLPRPGGLYITRLVAAALYNLVNNITAGFLNSAVGQGAAETGGNKHQLEVGARVDSKTAMENI